MRQAYAEQILQAQEQVSPFSVYSSSTSSRSIFSGTDLIFVTDITDYICGEILDFCKEFEQFMASYRNLCRFCSKFFVDKNPCGENLCGENLCGENKTNMRFVQELFIHENCMLSYFSILTLKTDHLCQHNNCLYQNIAPKRLLESKCCSRSPCPVLRTRTSIADINCVHRNSLSRYHPSVHPAASSASSSRSRYHEPHPAIHPSIHQHHHGQHPDFIN